MRSRSRGRSTPFALLFYRSVVVCLSLSLSLSFLVAASADCCLSLFFFLSLLFFSLLFSSFFCCRRLFSHLFFFLWGSPHVSTRAPSPHTRRDRVDRLSTNDAAERLCGDFYSHSAAPSTHVLEPKTKKRRAEHKPEWTELRNQLSTQRHENMKFHLFTNGKDFSIWKTLKRRRTSIIVFPGLFTAIFRYSLGDVCYPLEKNRILRQREITWSVDWILKRERERERETGRETRLVTNGIRPAPRRAWGVKVEV